MAEEIRRTYYEVIRPELQEKLSNYGIHRGVPLIKPESDYVGIPNEPHVFFVKELGLFTRNGLEKLATLQNVMVMHGHGMVLGPSEKEWFWANGKRVSEALKTYEDIAKELGWPQIDVISACRQEQESINQGRVSILFTHRIDTPYIYPLTNASNHGYQWYTKLVAGEGVNKMDLGANWQGIRRWQAIREQRDKGRTIPQWAKRAAI
jgi:hypothetical protein